MPNLTNHPTWCDRQRCDAHNTGGAHRGQLHHIGPVLLDLWQPRVAGAYIRLQVGRERIALPLTDANLLGNQLCDLVAVAGSATLDDKPGGRS